MAQIIISDSAHKDLSDIYTYIAEDSVTYAERQVQKILDNIEILAGYPLAGKILDEDFSKDVRILVSGIYHIVYLHNNDKVAILRIYHTKQIPFSYLNLFQ